MPSIAFIPGNNMYISPCSLLLYRGLSLRRHVRRDWRLACDTEAFAASPFLAYGEVGSVSPPSTVQRCNTSVSFAASLSGEGKMP